MHTFCICHSTISSYFQRSPNRCYGKQACTKCIFMIRRFRLGNTELSVAEHILLSLVCNDAVGSRCASWRIIRTLRGKSTFARAMKGTYLPPQHYRIRLAHKLLFRHYEVMVSPEKVCSMGHRACKKAITKRGHRRQSCFSLTCTNKNR